MILKAADAVPVLRKRTLTVSTPSLRLHSMNSATTPASLVSCTWSGSAGFAGGLGPPPRPARGGGARQDDGQPGHCRQRCEIPFQHGRYLRWAFRDSFQTHQGRPPEGRVDGVLIYLAASLSRARG